MAAERKRPTPSTLSGWNNFPTIEDPTAQLRLARAMGYPPGWRVVRSLITVPVPPSLADSMMASTGAATVTKFPDGTSMITAVQDRIYAGDPSTQPDGYYNHNAALTAAAKYPWRPHYDDVIYDNNDDDFDDTEFCSTSHKNRGGQLKSREAKFNEGDVVEVLYVEDEDDEEDEGEWYEATILKRVEYEDDIRYSVHYHADDAEQPNVREEYIRATHKTKQKKKKATKASKKKQTKPAASSAQNTKQKPGRRQGRTNKTTGRGRKHKATVAEEEAEDMFEEEPIMDEGDPPWRTTGHSFLTRRIRWTPPEDNLDLPHEPALGTVTGWISETDVDSEGNPGFESSKTGQPACLFHVIFEDFEQDFEEWELEEIFVEE